ncbi:MAG TPA: thiamine pyrophosphate-binding protein, partial [Coxiellaceae bacterium]|nr:thiamine pyrophosphate-binding protein [Coxiellaceae bacterium]
MKKLVSDVVVEILQQWGVERVYGIPNDTIDPLMESLRRQTQIQFILVRHEEAAAFAAAMEARLNGKIAVCIASQGPGAIHLLNGMYDAAMDGVPVIAITGQIQTALIGTRMVQEVNQNILFNDVCSFNGVVINPEQTIQVLSRAFRSAIMKRGPAHI